MNPQEPNPEYSNQNPPQPTPVEHVAINPVKPEKKAWLIATAVAMVLLVIVAVVFTVTKSPASDGNTTGSDLTSSEIGLGDTSEPEDTTNSAFAGAQKKARDQQRTVDINTLHSKLEEFYNENNYYPSTFVVSTFPGLDQESLSDPVGRNLITIHKPVADMMAADALAAPSVDTTATASYVYVPYPTGCSNNCTGYILKSYIELPTSTTPNPYVKRSLN